MRSLLLVVLLAGCGGGGGFPDARPIDGPGPMGTFSVTWTVSNTANQPVACSKIGALSVTVLAHNLAVLGGTTQVFTCETGMGMSQAMPVGTYDLGFELDSPSGVLATVANQRVDINANQNTVLQPLAFSLDATGALALTLASGKAGGNCGATATGGAGITSTTITLVHASDLSCAPVTFQISAGATKPAGTYTVNCNTPAVIPCIEADQTLSATGVAADAYQIHVKASAGTDCYSNNDALQVPPLGKTLMRTLNLAFSAGTTGC